MELFIKVPSLSASAPDARLKGFLADLDSPRGIVVAVSVAFAKPEISVTQNVQDSEWIEASPKIVIISYVALLSVHLSNEKLENREGDSSDLRAVSSFVCGPRVLMTKFPDGRYKFGKMQYLQVRPQAFCNWNIV